MKKISIILILVLFFCNSLESKGRVFSSKFNYDYNEYIIFYDNFKLFSMEEMLAFASFFDKRLNKLCKEYNTNIPVNLRVNLAIGAWIFKRLTGKDKNIGGLFDSKKGVFFFQNPTAMKRQGIRNRVVNHEILRYIIYKNRKTKRNKSNLWLEESYCESVFPSNNYSLKYIKNPMNNIRRYKSLKGLISMGTVSNSIKYRESAYFAAYQWGTFLNKKFGKKYFFKVCTGNEDDKKIKEAFKEFVKRFEK